MSKHAELVFRSADGTSYDTEEEALEASRRHYVRLHMNEAFHVNSGDTYTNRDRGNAMIWFLKDPDTIIAEYQKACALAEERLKEGT